MALHSVDAAKPNPIMAFETRPSNLTGFSWWIVLSYKEHHFEELLPQDFGGLDEAGQNLIAIQAASKLRARLRPIIVAEDEANAATPPV